MLKKTLNIFCSLELQVRLLVEGRPLQWNLARSLWGTTEYCIRTTAPHRAQHRRLQPLNRHLQRHLQPLNRHLQRHLQPLHHRLQRHLQLKTRNSPLLEGKRGLRHHYLAMPLRRQDQQLHLPNLLGHRSSCWRTRCAAQLPRSGELLPAKCRLLLPKPLLLPQKPKLLPSSR